MGSALYFIVTPHAPVRLHRVRNDQLYHYYLGDPIELFMLQAGGLTERVVVGPDLRNGQRIQLHPRQHVLGATTERPGLVPADVETGNLDKLAAKYPSVAVDLRAIAASVREVALAGAGRGKASEASRRSKRAKAAISRASR